MTTDRIARMLELCCPHEPDEPVRDSTGDCARLDMDRERRTGIPEVVFGSGKTDDQIVDILLAISTRRPRALATRIEPDVWERIRERLSAASYDERARTIMVGDCPPAVGRALVICTGYDDRSVAAEAVSCLNFFGVNAELLQAPLIADLVCALNEQDDYRAVIVTAGDQPQFVSITAGLISAPVIAVPVATRSAGNLDGISPLIVCLASCAPGVAVVNVDSGFGAAALARKIIGNAGA